MRARFSAITATIIGLAVLATLGACTAGNVTEVPRRPAILADLDGAKSQPIGLAKIVIRVAPGTNVGSFGQTAFCAPRTDAIMGSSSVVDSDLGAIYTRAFYDTVRNARYTVVGDPTALFEEESGPKPRYVVGGALTALQLDFCRPNVYEPNDISAGLYNKFEWQIYDTLERKVVYKTTTEGSYNTGGPVAGGNNIAISNAFEAAVSNLLAEQKFHDVLRQGSRASAGNEPVSPKDALKLAGGALKSGSIQSHMQDVRQSVLTVVVPSGHGSGFVIGDGYVLTNYHVAGDSGFVKLRTATGREILGEVVRANAARDIALIKTEERGLPALGLQFVEPEIGTDVYAIGAPFDEALSGSVSKGIVSSYRVTDDNQRHIQGDVDVNPGNSGGPLTDSSGNVIGVTSWGATDTGNSTGVNFFIPITDALKALNVSVRGSPTIATETATAPKSSAGEGASKAAKPIDERLAELKKLKDDGLISQEQFDQRRAEILKEL